MKRSEMVNLIAGYLEGPFTHGANWEDSEIKEYASNILLALERSGMLPPADRYQALRFPDADGTYIKAEFDNVNLELGQKYDNKDFWEPESDEN